MISKEEYLEAKSLRDKYNEIVSNYERNLRWDRKMKKTEIVKKDFSKGTLITFTGGSNTKQLKRESQYPVVSIANPPGYYSWMITVKNESGGYTRVPEYCFKELRELNIELDKESNKKLQ